MLSDYCCYKAAAIFSSVNEICVRTSKTREIDQTIKALINRDDKYDILLTAHSIRRRIKSVTLT